MATLYQRLIGSPLLGNLLHKLFSGNQPLLNQELRQCVGLSEAGDKKLLYRERFYRYASSLIAKAFFRRELERGALTQLQHL